MASSSFSTTAAAIMAAALLLLATITVTEAQGTANFPSCASKLVPCAEYIGNTTKPPATCCDPIKEAVKTELPCLCNLYNTPGLLNSFGINVTQAIGLTKRCGISADISNCSKPEHSRRHPAPFQLLLQERRQRRTATATAGAARWRGLGSPA
ncbi:Non-specific lipid transfer protein GPI-anchored 7 [Linum perenne]